MYRYLKDEMVKKDAAGNLADHVHKKNYDDINEFFWSKRCIDGNISMRLDRNIPQSAWAGQGMHLAACVCLLPLAWRGRGR
jgi:hypothetical protein